MKYYKLDKTEMNNIINYIGIVKPIDRKEKIMFLCFNFILWFFWFNSIYSNLFPPYATIEFFLLNVCLTWLGILHAINKKKEKMLSYRFIYIGLAIVCLSLTGFNMSTGLLINFHNSAIDNWTFFFMAIIAIIVGILVYYEKRKKVISGNFKKKQSSVNLSLFAVGSFFIIKWVIVPVISNNSNSDLIFSLILYAICLFSAGLSAVLFLKRNLIKLLDKNGEDSYSLLVHSSRFNY